jgi:hypothetical protein
LPPCWRKKVEFVEPHEKVYLCGDTKIGAGLTDLVSEFTVTRYVYSQKVARTPGSEKREQRTPGFDLSQTINKLLKSRLRDHYFNSLEAYITARDFSNKLLGTRP